MKTTPVAIVGAAGYSGQELEKLLKRHSHFEVKERVGREYDLSQLKGKVELIFLCTPAETSLEMTPKLLEMGIHVVDLAGTFRLKRHSYPEWYGFAAASPELLDRAEYGLFPYQKIPSLHDKKGVRLISNPGCYATAIALGLIPLVKSGHFKNDHFFVDAKSGTSGAGRKAQTELLFAEIYNEFKPYKVGRHQHWPEIVEAVEAFSGEKISPVLVTELLPTFRGISVCLFGNWKSEAKSPAELVKLFEKAYESDPQIEIISPEQTPSLKTVLDTNQVLIAPHVAYGRPVVFVMIDNLQRGAAGQALMNANQLYAFDTYEGLK